MSTKQTQEALKLALEALDEFMTDYQSEDGMNSMKHYAKKHHAAITAIREALADHSTNRPISRLDAYPKEQVAAAKEDVLSAVEHHGLSEQPAHQEPVAVVSGYYGGQCVILPIDPARIFNSNTTLYTSPPASKPWVGLTNQELIDLTAIYSGAPLYCAIEAKLKEKNA